MSKRKYFIAIVLPEPAQSEIEKIKQRLYAEHNLKGALRSPAHITLHRPFEWKEEKENILLDALSEFSDKSNFELNIHNYDFFEPRVIFAAVNPNPELNLLHNKLTEYCKRHLSLFNEADDLRGFHPHVTVAFRDLKKNLFYQLKDEFARNTISLKFHYNGFSLLKLENNWEVLKNYKIQHP